MAGGRIYALQVKSFPHILEVIMWETGIAEVSQRRWFGWKFPVKFRGRPLSVPFMRISSRWNGRKREWFDWFPITHSPITVSFEPWVNKTWRLRKRKLSTFISNFVWLMMKGTANNSRQKCIGMKCNQYFQFNAMSWWYQNCCNKILKKIKCQNTFGRMQSIGDIRIIAPKSQIPKYRNTFGWMLYVDSIIITICRNGTDHHHHQDQDRPVCLSKSFWNFLEHNTYQTSFLVTGKHTKIRSKYKHHHIVQEGGLMGLHYTSVNLTMIGNVSTTTTSTTLEDIEGVRSVRVYCGLLVVVVIVYVVIFLLSLFMLQLFLWPQQRPARPWRILRGWGVWEFIVVYLLLSLFLLPLFMLLLFLCPRRRQVQLWRISRGWALWK